MQNNKSKQNQAKNEILTDWQRIEMVIQQSKLTVNAFARHIGLPRGENLYQIKKGNNGISLDVAKRIVSKFPQVDKLWLLTGDGQMLRDDAPAGPCMGCRSSFTGVHRKRLSSSGDRRAGSSG